MVSTKVNGTTIGVVTLIVISLLALFTIGDSGDIISNDEQLEITDSERIRLRHGGNSATAETNESGEEVSDVTVETEPLKYTIPDEDIKSLVDAISSASAKNPFGEYGLFQMLDQGFVQMTKHWICDVKRFGDVLPITVFVTTDEVARDSLREFDSSLNIVFIPFRRGEATTELSFGQVRYYELMNFRTELVLRTLESGNGIMLVESDAYWSRNVLKDIQDLKIPNDYDMVSASDRITSNRLQGGFQINRPTENSKLLWSKLHKKMSKAIERLESQHGKDSTDFVHNEGSEQVMMEGLIKNLGRKVGYKHIYLPPTVVASGIWYKKSKRPKGVTGIDDPAVVLNNWISGNTKKIERAIKWKHYFLNNETGECIEP